ncbi:MAG: PilW family protein [Desulfuromusa sp.]|nr:PilW family protein [Desulfuromusa sp.]
MAQLKLKTVTAVGHAGFTLVELLIALAISGVLMTAVYATFQSQQNNYLAQEQVAEMQQNIRAGLDIMVSELRMAGYDVDKNGDKTGTAGITVADAGTITFTVVADTDGVDNDNDSPTEIDEQGELKTIKYELYDAYSGTDGGHDDIGRQVGASASTKRAVAENIEHLEFYYKLADGTQTTAPTAAQLELIRSIQISILAITRNPDRNYTNNKSYNSLSGADWTPAPPDHFRRRFQTMTVKCRNLGL